jgi:transcriptional regulator with XRE-family HTH domain
VGYLETAQRKPSLRLLKRMASILELDPRALFILCHPEAEFLREENGEPKRKPEIESDPWRRFLSNRALLKRNKVTATELKLLKQVSLLSDVSHPRDFLFILNTIRQATKPDP